MKLKVWVEIHAVEVDAARVRAVVAALDAVGVQHRDEFEDVLAPQLTRARVVLAQDEVEEAVEDKAARRLTGVNSACDDIHL